MTTRKGYADGPFGQVHYQEAGSGVPLVLLHQTPCSSDMFRPAYALLATLGIRVIGMDTPGYGHSAPPPRPSIPGYARSLLALLDHLGLATASLLGHHTGASTAAELAVMAPERVSRLILNGTLILEPAARRAYYEAIRAEPPVVPAEDGSHLTRLWERRKHFTPGWTSLAAMHAGFVQMLQAGPRERDGYEAAFAHDITVPLALIRQPTLLLTNTGDDLYAATGTARKLRPDFAWVALAGGTHDIVEEQPEAWSEAVARFVLAPPAQNSV